MANFTISEILSTVKELDYANALKKKEINEKFGLSGSKKTKEIEHELLGIAMDLRKKKITSYEYEDFYVWNKYWNYPSSKVKIAEAMKGETEGWAKFVLGIYRGLYERSIGKVSEDKRYVHLLKIIDDNSPETQSKNRRIDFIYNKLIDLTSMFRDQMYNRFINDEKIRFSYFKNIYDSLDKSTRVEYRKENPKTYSVLVKIEAKSDKFNWEKYKEYLNKEFDSMFDNNIKAIAQRINANKNVNINNLKLKSIQDDPKFFEVVLRDCGNYLIHCRSIIAAENSYLVQTHYRFIVTVKHI